MGLQIVAGTCTSRHGQSPSRPSAVRASAGLDRVAAGLGVDPVSSIHLSQQKQAASSDLLEVASRFHRRTSLWPSLLLRKRWSSVADAVAMQLVLHSPYVHFLHGE